MNHPFHCQISSESAHLIPKFTAMGYQCYDQVSLAKTIEYVSSCGKVWRACYPKPALNPLNKIDPEPDQVTCIEIPRPAST